MVRRVDEPIEVRPQDVPLPAAEGSGTSLLAAERGAPLPAAVAERAPGQFLWRGRLYQVREVIDCWQEQRAWWRDALAATPTPGVAARGRQVWRVLASPGRTLTPGVFELGHDPEPSRWLLLRTQD